MPLSEHGATYFKGRDVGPASVTPAEARRVASDGFQGGDYSLGLFHHDASEAAIELFRHDALRDAAAGSLLNLLDCAAPSGRVHRTELPHKSREAEPAKPIIAQYALGALDAMGEEGPEWAERYDVFPRAQRFIHFLEREYVGLHGLFLTHSSLQSGFDSDVLSAGFPDKTVEGPDTNAFMVLEYRALATLAGRLGKRALANELGEKAERLRALMEDLLWYEDETGGRYTALLWRHGSANLEAERVGALLPDGRVTPYESWVSLLPLYAGIPTPARAERLVAKLLEPRTYWGPHGVRTVPADDVYFHQAPRVMHFDFKRSARGPVSNWSGPVWVLSNFDLTRGLLRYGRRKEARELALKTAALLANGLERQGALHECYDDRGNGLWPRTGTFISWNVLALSMLTDTA
jgi:hypothetical protein